jgi:CRP/FNR family cyclic AMP-dependent transcriptional regulator
MNKAASPPASQPDAAELSPVIVALLALGRKVTFVRGDRVLIEGQSGDCLYILLAGRVRVYVNAEDYRCFVIGTYGVGTLFGEGALDGGPRTASVEALTGLECAQISYADLRQKLAEDPAFALALTMELIGRSRSTARRLKLLALGSVYERFRDLAEQEARPVDGGSCKADATDGPRALPPEWTQQEIAQRLGASRDMLTRILRELGKGGYVDVGRGRIILLRPLPRRW